MSRTIGIVSPAQKFRGGNTVTAARWLAIFRELGWRVFEESAWKGRSCDVLLALHARRTHDSIVRFSEAHPDLPLIVAAAGTDVYGDDSISTEAHDSFLRAGRIVVLQPRAVERLPESTRGRARVVYQSVIVPNHRPPKAEDAFQVCSIAHLRSVKDPLLPAHAARLLKSSSRLRVVHLGSVIEKSLRADVEREQRENPRFLWLGERSREEALDVLARSHLFVSSSRHEGGSNVISEALALGVAVLATAIPGSEGLLGNDHQGLYPVGDARRLAELLSRAETDREFLGCLTERSVALGVLTDPARERESWRVLLEEVAG